MDLRASLIIFIAISLIVYFIPVDKVETQKKEIEVPQFIFNNATMYSLDENGLNRYITASQALNFKTKDIMYDANITLYNQDRTKNFYKESLRSKNMLKVQDIYTFTDNVEYKRDNFMQVNTDKLIYDDKNKILQNNTNFNARYYTHKYSGDTLFLDINSSSISSKNTNFKIDMKKN